MIAASLGLALASLALPAHAQPDDARKQARAAFGRATAAEAREDWRAAILEYSEAYRLAPHPDVLYNLGAVYERLGEARAAAEQYQQYLDTKPDAADRRKVERKIAALAARPSKVAITTTPAGAAVTVDGQARGSAPVELSLAAGSHTLVAASAGAQVTRAITVGYGEPLAITLPVVVARGTLVVTSNVPGAAIAVDGSQVGAAPWTGPLDAGRHVVVISAPGYTTTERAVEVPADGTTQISGGLGRPLGYVEPPSRRTTPLLGFDGGTFGDIGVVVRVYYGFRSSGRHVEGGLGGIFAGSGVGFAGTVRGYLLTGRVRPYVELGIGLGGTTQIAHAAGGLMLANVPFGRAGVDLYVEAGYGGGKRVDDRVEFVPILIGVTGHVLDTP